MKNEQCKPDKWHKNPLITSLITVFFSGFLLFWIQNKVQENRRILDTRLSIAADATTYAYKASVLFSQIAIAGNQHHKDPHLSHEQSLNIQSEVQEKINDFYFFEGALETKILVYFEHQKTQDLFMEESKIVHDGIDDGMKFIKSNETMGWEKHQPLLESLGEKRKRLFYSMMSEIEINSIIKTNMSRYGYKDGD